MLDDKEYIIKANLYDGLECDDDIIFYQNDTSQCKIIAEFTGKKRAAIDVSNCTVVCIIQKGDKEIVTAYMDNNNISNRAEYVLSQNALASIGKGTITIFVYDNDNGRQTFGSIKFKVLKDVNAEDIESTTDYPILTKLINDTRVVSFEAESVKEEILGVSADIANSEKKRVIAEEERSKNESIRSKKFNEMKEEHESLLDESIKFTVVGEHSSVPSIGVGGSGGGYVHPATHPASMITGLATVATSGKYSDLIERPAKLSEFQNDIGLGSGTGISTTLDKYEGNTLGAKMIAMFADINKNHKHTPMLITLPDGIIEITSNLKAVGWTNKIFIGNTYLYYNNCDAIEFIKCKHCKFYIHASSSSPLDIAKDNILGLISPSSVKSLTKRGYKITDCCYNDFTFNNIIGFTNGIEFYSEYGAEGTFYNNIYYTAIWRCQRPMTFKTGKASDDTSGQSGWITEIYVHGGMFDCDDGVLIGQEVGSRPANEPSDNYQGLKFYNVGVEHIRKKADGVGFYFLQGKNNAIINPRFEGSLGNGNSTSGAYILVKESGYACNNRIETSNYPINVDRVELNCLAKQLANPSYDNPAGSYIEGDLYDNNGSKCGYKAIATPGKMAYEARNLSNYYLNNSKNNTINFTYSDTEFAKVKGSDGVIRTIGYTS